MKTYKTDHFV